MVNAVNDHVTTPDFIRGELRKRFGKRELIGMIRKHLADEGRKPVEVERLLPTLVPSMVPLMEKLLEDYAQGAAPIVAGGVRSAANELPTTLKRQFIQAMSSGLESNPRTAAFENFSWFLVDLADRIILGDSVCLFETTGGRRFKPLFDKADSTTRIFLPLAHNRLLVGTNTGIGLEIDVALLNSAFARCSLEYFVSSKSLTDPSLHESIGSWAGIFTRNETATLIDGVLRDF